MDTKSQVCACEYCESPDKHNIFAEGFCQECYEECREESNPMPKINKCDLCLEVSIFETLVKFEKLDICEECAEKIEEQHERLMRHLDQQ